MGLEQLNVPEAEEAGMPNAALLRECGNHLKDSQDGTVAVTQQKRRQRTNQTKPSRQHCQAAAKPDETRKLATWREGSVHPASLTKLCLKTPIVGAGRLSRSEEPHSSVRNGQQDEKIPACSPQGDAFQVPHHRRGVRPLRAGLTTDREYCQERTRLLGPELLVSLHGNEGETTRGFREDKGNGRTVPEALQIVT